MWSRRRLLAAAAGAPLATLAGCSGRRDDYDGGWVGASHERGHRLRDLRRDTLPAPAVQRRAGVLVVGAGIAGLACARALARAGIENVQLFELEDEAGGNSRGHRMGGMACPLGAHYLPLPGPPAVEVAELLQELGLARVEHGRVVYDERHLCHSPQERLFIDGQWREGLLPPLDALPAGERDATLAQYRAFAQKVARWSDGRAFTIPTARSTWGPEQAALDRLTFADWLTREGLVAPALRWYLDYCCRDDYGAGSAEVSAWAGLHYFASRHGFRAPGEGNDEHDGLLTWPEGNAWLARRLAEPLRERLHTGMLALRVIEGKHAVEADFWNVAAQRIERWSAPQAVLATPLFVSARLLDSPSSALTEAAQRLRYAPWQVANLQLADALDDRPGAPPSWDNVLYGGASLGYVDAMHQGTLPYPTATVLTAYWSWGAQPAHRQALLQDSWRSQAQRVVAELAPVHPDLPHKVRRIDLMRYGHAMSIPVPGVRSSAALQALAETTGRVHFAHSDLSAYSVFEEAYAHGVRAARACRAAQGVSPAELATRAS
ncbi:MAG TPA: FAD-dependent oxidoreductase [Albitalea sp.]|nr:FAD-dependent oxidoreductase [Albitalea sp.]